MSSDQDEPSIIEDPDLALPFTPMLRARELRLRAVGGLVAEAMSYAISRHYNADVEAHLYSTVLLHAEEGQVRGFLIAA
jgi:hypothetical protein